MLMSSGTDGGGTVIANGSAFDTPPPTPAALGGVATVTLDVPGLATSAEGICATNCVAEIKLVGRLAPFHLTTDVPTKLLPVTVSTNAGLPAFVAPGLMLVSCGAGAGAVMVNGNAFDVPPPAPAVFGGVKTVTLAVPALAMSEAGICAVNCVGEITVVGRFAPFQRTSEAAVKLLPVAVNTNAGLPASAVFGRMLASVGAEGGSAVIVNGNGFEVLPAGPPATDGLKTVTLAVPAVARLEAGTVAVNCAVVTKVVTRSAPFHRTVETRLKFAPLAISVSAGEPAGAEFGEMLESAGAGFCAWPVAKPPVRKMKKTMTAACLSLANRDGFDRRCGLCFINSQTFFSAACIHLALE
jgi:hypothetical protein